ncbi:AAA family ATPase [Polyangium aurulentum]|uniref:AAA family ATPase n=1 Tax=Polyangium aurulentum TaxID=2567896 RepID=UPI0010AE82D7|nr:ATP-binding protein [Polyangium aurulentum]UQA57579.1 ATP-binding protein [Polyangium aurulentum]
MPRVRRPRRPVVTSVSIRNFKSLVAQSIELGRLNVLIGANGSGKTALLEAIGVLGAAADGRVEDGTLLRRGVRPGVPRLYKSNFGGRTEQKIVLEARSSASATYRATLVPGDVPASPWRFNNETLEVSGDKAFTRSPGQANVYDAEGTPTKFKPGDPYRGLAPSPGSHAVPRQAADLLEMLVRFAIYDPQTLVLRGTQADLHQLDPLGLQGGRLAEALGQIKEKLPMADLTGLLDWVADVGSEPPSPDLLSPSIPAVREVVRFTDRYMRPGSNRLSAYDASEGALYVLFALALLFHPRTPPFFAIENIDHALHPRLARALVRKMAEYTALQGKQILLTTHNPLVLDGLPLADDGVRLFTVDRTVQGQTQVSRVAYTDAIRQAEEKDVPLSQLWVQGALGGGVPNIW